jgi:succinyl-CoA synthetase beta subunit
MPLQGQRDALEALALAGLVGSRWRVGTPVVLQLPRGTGAQGAARTLAEHEGKAVLSTFGVSIPRGKVVATQAVDAEAAARDAAHAAAHLGFPVAIKATGPQMTHKTELAAVALNIRTAAEAFTAAARLLAFAPDLLVEEMVTDAVAELLVGISVDPQFGQVLVIGSGGVFAELLADTVSLLPPWTAASIDAALETLAVAKLLRGFRGKPAADRDSLVAAILAVGRYATANQATVLEIDVNPLLASARGAIAVDVLIRLQDS